MSGDHNLCKVEFERWFIGPIGKGRKKKQGVIYTDETIKCDCKCHRKDKQ
jgi:hypothetical protein